MQDMVMWYARGPIVDRTTEEVDDGDNGIILHRRLLEQNIQRGERGEDPIGVVRDPARNVRIPFVPDEPMPARPERERGMARTYAAPPDRYDQVAMQLRELAASRRG